MATLHFTEGQQEAPWPVGHPPQLLPNVVDGMARARPRAVYAMITKSPTAYDQGYRSVSYEQLASCVNGIAWLLTGQLGPGKASEPLAYVGPNDIGYVIMVLGAAKAGYSLLLPSPRNTGPDQASLFRATDCKVILTPKPPYSATVQTILAALPEALSKVVHVPTTLQLLETNNEHFPYPKSYDKAKNEPLLIVHTSGTTSTPKPVTYTNALVAAYTSWMQYPSPPGYETVVSLIQSVRVLVTLPFFHAGCLYKALFDAIQRQSIVVTLLPGAPPSAQSIVDALSHVDVDAVLLVAPLMEQLSKSPKHLAFVTSKVKTAVYGGGDVSDPCGSAFAASVNVASFFGSTETTSIPAIRPRQGYSSSDWKYLQPHPLANVDFQATDADDLFEAVIVRNKDSEHTQPVFVVLPDLDEYRTRDLYSPHPSTPGLWKYRGRADDLINFKSGHLLNPVPYEHQLAQHPKVQSALLIGFDRYRPALILEPSDATVKGDELVEHVWPAVNKANELLPFALTVARSRILVTSPERPLMRAGKGTVQRAASVLLYKPQIDHLYEETGDTETEPIMLHAATAAT